jgi:hypothetical protein
LGHDEHGWQFPAEMRSEWQGPVFRRHRTRHRVVGAFSDQTLRRPDGLSGGVVRSWTRRGLRIPWSQRRRQDHHGENTRYPVAYAVFGFFIAIVELFAAPSTPISASRFCSEFFCSRWIASVGELRRRSSIANGSSPPRSDGCAGIGRDGQRSRSSLRPAVGRPDRRLRWSLEHLWAVASPLR